MSDLPADLLAKPIGPGEDQRPRTPEEDSEVTRLMRERDHITDIVVPNLLRDAAKVDERLAELGVNPVKVRETAIALAVPIQVRARPSFCASTISFETGHGSASLRIGGSSIDFVYAHLGVTRRERIQQVDLLLAWLEQRGIRPVADAIRDGLKESDARS